MDWASRRILAWRLSNTLTTDFCIEALEETIGEHGAPQVSTSTRACNLRPAISFC